MVSNAALDRMVEGQRRTLARTDISDWLRGAATRLLDQVLAEQARRRADPDDVRYQHADEKEERRRRTLAIESAIELSSPSGTSGL